MHNIEPSMIKEFRECTSEYQIPNKLDEDEISSDGEFQQAKNLRMLDESCTEVFIIEQKQQYQTKTGKLMPS